MDDMEVFGDVGCHGSVWRCRYRKRLQSHRLEPFWGAANSNEPTQYGSEDGPSQTRNNQSWVKNCLCLNLFFCMHISCPYTILPFSYSPETVRWSKGVLKEVYRQHCSNLSHISRYANAKRPSVCNCIIPLVWWYLLGSSTKKCGDSLLIFMCSYCDCFAAGVFCIGPACSCVDCCNKPVHRDSKVMESRKKIESRDPLAFAPRIISRSSDSVEQTRVRSF